MMSGDARDILFGPKDEATESGRQGLPKVSLCVLLGGIHLIFYFPLSSGT